jgi:hypothetical protein
VNEFVKRAILGIALLFAAFAATTWWALESSGVAVVETRTATGDTRSTHVWYTELSGELWLEAGTPENPWFRDVQQTPVLTFRADDRTARYAARPIEDPSGHDRIRALMREKYGLRDRYVALLFDTRHSIAVELVPIEE